MMVKIGDIFLHKTSDVEFECVSIKTSCRNGRVVSSIEIEPYLAKPSQSDHESYLQWAKENMR